MKNYFTIIGLMVLTIFTCANINKVDFRNWKLADKLDGIHSGIIDLNNLDNYANQTVPNYITQDNTAGNAITDIGATLGRVLFYDKNLSSNNTISCASCHQQQFAFSDTAQASVGVNGTTGRHAMRLVNSRFAEEVQFFWDERAATLEIQTTQPIQDHAEMGFSGTNGDPDLDSLIRKLEDIPYYQMLFNAAFGDAVITEERMQQTMAQFIRSIQSFDAPFDVGLAQVANPGQNFPNYSADENAGKQLFLTPPQIDANTGQRVSGGFGCAGCHRPPEFDIAPNSLNNGVIASINGTGPDLANTRSPSLRDVVDGNGNANGPMMHNGNFNTLAGVLIHYNHVQNNNAQLDPRLKTNPGPNGVPTDFQMTVQERNQMVSFIETLTGNNVYTDLRWSNPFDANDDLNVIAYVNTTSIEEEDLIKIYPTYTNSELIIETPYELQNENMWVFDMSGRVVYSGNIQNRLNVSHYQAGMYLLKIKDKTYKFVKH